MSLAGISGWRQRIMFPAALGLLAPAYYLGSYNLDDLRSDGHSSEGAAAAAVVVQDLPAARFVLISNVPKQPCEPFPISIQCPPLSLVSAPLPQSVQSGVTAVAKTPVPAIEPDPLPVAAEAQAAPAPMVAETGPIAEARQLIADSREAFKKVSDYTCTFTKRERMDDGSLVGPHAMQMKVLTRPHSVYFKFMQPFAGREVIWVTGGNDGKVLVHEGGMARLIAGTLKLEPTSVLAMKGCRHPITEAGLGYLIEQVSTRWDIELKPGETEVNVNRDTRVGNRVCTMIESKHPVRHEGYTYHKIKLYVDDELHLPIRFEAYAWPREEGAPAELIEEYTYLNLSLNNELDSDDFNPANSSYGFTRF